MMRYFFILFLCIQTLAQFSVPYDIDLSLDDVVLRRGESQTVGIYAVNLTDEPLLLDGVAFYIEINHLESPSPIFTSCDYVTGTVFDNVNQYGITEIGYEGKAVYWTAGTELEGTLVILRPHQRELMATVTIFADDSLGGPYSYSYNAIDYGDSFMWIGSVDNVMDGGYSLSFRDGLINVIPEPPAYGVLMAYGLIGFVRPKRSRSR